MQKLINAEKSDLFDVLEYVFNSDIKPITREERATRAKTTIFVLLNDKQKEFIEFVLSKYVEAGVSEPDQEKLPNSTSNKIPVVRRCYGNIVRCGKYKFVVYRFSEMLIRNKSSVMKRIANLKII